MNKISTKRLASQHGDIEYNQVSGSESECGILFIHGLGVNKEWFKEQYLKFNLNENSWIVPDLLGHGKSDKPRQEIAYTMKNQANLLHNLLLEEKMTRIIIFAHSMGGPIAISLIEDILNCNAQNLNTKKIEILGLFYLEGNLDEGDATFSSLIANKSLDDFETHFESFLNGMITEYGDEIRSYCDGLRAMGPYPLWASCKDLVSQSKSHELLPRLKKCLHFPVHFVFGELNKGVLSSEVLITEANLPIIYIPKIGHDLHEGNPSDFWEIIKDKIQKIIKT